MNKMTKQKLVTGWADSFESTLNEWFERGWRVVPGTLGGASFRCVAKFNHKHTPDGEGFEHRMWCVVEKVLPGENELN